MMMRAVSLLASSYLVFLTESARREISGQKMLGMSAKFWIVKHNPISLPSTFMITEILPSSSKFPMIPRGFPPLLITGMSL
jgi:hypothetical protein